MSRTKDKYMGVRQEKVAATIKKLVATLLSRGDFADPRVTGMITVTRVEITPDLREAKVYVSVFQPDGGSVSAVMHGLQSATRAIQNDVAKALPMRMAPHLSFVLDERFKKEQEILQTIEQVSQERLKREEEKGKE